MLTQLSTNQRKYIKSVSTLIGIIMALSPVSVLADTSPSTCTPPNTSKEAGVHQPTGSSASTYTYDCATGMWTNAYYTYDPATNTYSPNYQQIYTYNSTTGMWDYPDWVYVASSKSYIEQTQSVSQPPAGAETVGGPTVQPDSASSSGNSGSTQADSATGNSGDGTGATGSNGNKQDNSYNQNTGVNNQTTANVNNGITQQSSSGNALVQANTNAGNAITGESQDIASVINMLQSSSNVIGNPQVVTFTDNINGDVNGNLLLDPAQLGAVQPADTTNSLNNNVVVNNSTNENINNDINLAANSGNATVSQNTQAGNAQTGNAEAVANIVNILDSAITAGQSFIGVININGNLNGDILLPPNFVNTLLADNVPYTTISATAVNNTLTDTNTNNETINNAIDSSAQSGSATVAGNTAAGNATTGSANTNVTVFNLTGSNIVGSNDLLVFVNVQGSWVGMILNAPAGTTAAEIGGGITANTLNNQATVNNTNNQNINNNVKLAAQSGNATVSDNTQAGSATSGNAFTNINLMNMINDSLSLNGWFGLLFINVFGTWNGSLAVEPITAPSLTPPNASDASTGASQPPVKQVFTFVPSLDRSVAVTAYPVDITTTNSAPPHAVLADQVTNISKISHYSAKLASSKGNHNYVLTIIGVIIAAILLAASERKRFFRRG